MNFNDYKNKLPFPSSDERYNYHVYQNGSVLFNNITRDTLVEQFGQSYAKRSDIMASLYEAVIFGQSYAKRSDIMIEKVRNPSYQEKADAYQEKTRELMNKFKKDLFEEFDVVNNPKAEKAYSIAWDRGHSSGLSSVYDEFEELVDLIK